MEFLEYMKLIKKRWLLVFMMTLVSVLISAVLSTFVITPVYEAKTTLLIGQTLRSQDEKVQYDVILAYQKLIKTYSELAKSRMIAEETIKALGVDMVPEVLIKNLRVSPRGDTQILEISVQDTNQKRVIQTANTFSRVFVEKVREMMSTDDLTIVDEARLPARLVMPDMLMNMVIGALAGLILSFVIAFLAERADTTLKSVEEVEKKIGIQVLESIPYINNF